MQERKVSQAPDLFSPVDVGPLGLKKRVVKAPLTRSRAGPGNVATQLNALYYAQRASAGLIIAEATQIAPEGQGYISTPGIHSAEQVEGWKCVTKAVHIAGGPLCCNSGTLDASPIHPSNLAAPYPSRRPPSNPMGKPSRQRALSQSQRHALLKPQRFPASSSNMREPRETLLPQDLTPWRCMRPTAI